MNIQKTLRNNVPLNIIHVWIQKPELLDAGNYFLLAHLPTPWSVDCKNTDQLPGRLEGNAYTIVMKFDMCGGEIKAGVETI